MALTLDDLFIGVDVVNRTGRVNITGQELADLINAQGASGNIGKGALVTGPNISMPNMLNVNFIYDTIIYDDLGFVNLGADATRLTIPNVTPAIQRVKAGGACLFGAGAGGTTRQLLLRYNFNTKGSLFPSGQNDSDTVTGGVSSFGSLLGCESGGQPVSVADFFQLGGFQDSGGAINAVFPAMWIRVTQ